MNSKQFCSSDKVIHCYEVNWNKIDVRIKPRGAMVGIKLERGWCWEKLEKIVLMRSVCLVISEIFIA